MKFFYCLHCKELRPRSWYHFGKCLICGERCAVIVVPISVFGYLMYGLSIVGAVFVVLELIGEDLGLGGLRLYILFGSIILALVFYFLELDRATVLAQEKVRQRY